MICPGLLGQQRTAGVFRRTFGKSGQFSVQRIAFNPEKTKKNKEFTIVLLVGVKSVMLMVEIFRQPTNLLIENQPYLE
jgi:hypothetical protein